MPALKPTQETHPRLQDPPTKPPHIHLSVDLAEGTRLKISAWASSMGKNFASAPVSRQAAFLPVLRGLISRQIKARMNAGILLFTALVILLSAIPPSFVIKDRWLAIPGVSSPLDSLWCRVGFLCSTQLPPYFSAVIACSLALFLLIFLKREKHLRLSRPWEHRLFRAPGTLRLHPVQARLGYGLLGIAGLSFFGAALVAIRLQQVQGWWFLQALIFYALGWLLIEIPWEQIRSAWQRSSGALAAFTLAHATLILFLSHLSQSHFMNWVDALALGLAWANLARYYRRIPAILWVVTVALILFTFRINHWAYSVIGDESDFFRYALQIAEQFRPSDTITHLFDGRAVYDTHPFFSSFIQAISMKFLGENNFGWRFSSLYLSALSIGFFYYFFKQFVSEAAAMLAVLFLAGSHYLMTFGKIGYNNLQALFAMSLVLWAAAWGIRSRGRLAFVILGLSMGLCFYVYPSALYALPLPILLLILYDPPISTSALKHWAVMIVSLVIFVFPLFVQPGYWQSKVAGTIYNNPGIVASSGSILFHFATNLLYAFYSFLYIPEESHFVVVSYTDPLAAALVLIGLPVAVQQARKGRFMVFFLASFGLLLFLVGASHDRLTPSATRMFMLLPWFFLLAAIGLIWLTKQVRRSGLRIFSRAGMAALLMGCVFSLNLYQAYSLSPQRSNRYQSIEMLFVRMVQRIQGFDPMNIFPMTYLFITDRNWGIEGFYLLARIYEFPASKVHLQQVTIDSPQLPEQAREWIADPKTLAIVSPFMNEDWQTKVAASLSGSGKQACTITALNGDRRFLLAYSPDFHWLCNSQ